MRTLREFNDDLTTKSENHLGFNLASYPQRSEQWLKSRLGVITASNAIAILKEGRKKGTQSALWDTYMLELISEIVTGEAKSTAKTIAMDWGNAYEHEARTLFGFDNNVVTEELTFCYRDNMRCGASPDLIIEGVGLGEIKCPFNSSNHISFLLDDSKIKAEYKAQMQFQMWVMDSPLCHFISYDPRAGSNNIKSVIIEKDNDTINKFEERIPLFIEQMDEKLDKLNIKFGDQWK